MTDRRRFFPSRPVQTVPGNTVELAVQLRKEPVMPAEPGAAVVSWFPALTVEQMPQDEGAQDTDWIAVEGAPYGVAHVYKPSMSEDYGFSALPSKLPGYLNGGLNNIYVSRQPVVSMDAQCVAVSINVANSPYWGRLLQGGVIGDGTGVTWSYTWDVPYQAEGIEPNSPFDPSVPGVALSGNADAAFANGGMLYVGSRIYQVDEGIYVPPVTLTAVASRDGVEIGRLYANFYATYY